MSLADRHQAARSALEAIAHFARETGQAAIATMAELGLKASGETPAQVARRQADAERKRTVRGRPPDVHADGVRTSAGRRADSGGGGGGISLKISERDQDPNPQVGESEGEGPQDGVRTSAGRPIRNATDDGAFGDTVGAWCEGISEVTAKPCTRPMRSLVLQLIECQLNHRPATEEPVAWSKASAAEYARANAGRELSVFGYVRWLDSGKPERESGTRPVVAPSDHNPNPISAHRPLTGAKLDEALRLKAQRRDEEQAARARVAATRPTSEPTKIGGTKT